jgi:hypothetical protein
MGADAEAFAAARHSLERCVAAHDELYSELIARKSKAAVGEPCATADPTM